MKVLVTGASGMLGGGVARALAARGDEVTVLQRRPAGLGLPERLADLADAGAVRRAVAGQEAVVHLAAKVDVVGPWAAYERTNVTGTATLVDACRTEGVRRFVFTSSPSVAHVGRSIVGGAAAPADPDRARGNYARSKAAAEQLALAADGGSLAVTALRPHLVWGPGDAQLVHGVVSRARAGRLTVVGTGAVLVDTVYVDNAVDAHLAALDRCEQVRGEAFVVSNGEPRPVSEVFAAFCTAAGVPVPTRRVPGGLARVAGTVLEAVWPRDSQPPLTRFLVEQLLTAHWFDQRRTRQALGWTPRVSLDEGFDRLAASFA